LRRTVGLMLLGALLVGLGGWAASAWYRWNGSSDDGDELTARGREIRRLLHEGRNAFAEEDWSEVVRCYRRVVQWAPDHSSAWMHLAYGLHRLERWDEAIAALEECARFGSARPWAMYNLATIYARRDQPKDALDYLTLAIEEGFQPKRPLVEEPSFANLLDDPRFQTLVERARPLSERMTGKQLEFLTGQWDIVNQAENAIGQVRYEREVDGFVVRGVFKLDENRSASVYYFFEPGTGQWVRTEVASDGTVTQCRGSFRLSGNRRRPLVPLVLRGERVTVEGKRERCRITVFPRTLQQIVVSVEIWDSSRKHWQTERTMLYIRPTALSVNR